VGEREIAVPAALSSANWRLREERNTTMPSSNGKTVACRAKLSPSMPPSFASMARRHKWATAGSDRR
jgi:hypothetical protein